MASCHLTIASEIETVPARAAPAYLAGKRPSCARPNEFAKPAKTMTVSEQIQKIDNTSSGGMRRKQS